jgi:hypothetical protein
MKNVIILFSLIAVLDSCYNSGDADLKPRSVKIDRIDSTFLCPFGMTAFNNHLLLTGEYENNLIHIYDPVEMKTIFSGFKTGRGPDEMLDASSAQITQNDHIWIYDFITRQFNQFIYISDSLKPKGKIKTDHRIMSPHFISDSALIALNTFESSKGWVSMFDKNGDYVKSLVEFPVNKDVLPDPIFTESYQGKLLINPDRRNFVVACRYSDRLSIYDVKGNHISTFRSDRPFEPIMIVEQTPDSYNMLQTEDTKIGFPEIAVSNDFIFALFSGKSRKTANPATSNRVYQLTWTGKLTNIYETDLSIIDLEWSEFYNCLYMFATDNYNYYLGRLALPEDL